MDYKIESVTSDDYVEIVEVWEASVRASHHFLTEENIQYFKPLILKEYLKAVELRCVKDAQGNIVGFSGVADQKLEMLFIHPESMGKGIGKALFYHAVEKFNVNKVDVNEDNPDAVRFYEHVGFVTTSRDKLDGLGMPFPILHMELMRTK